jgi:hypothetical protein
MSRHLEQHHRSLVEGGPLVSPIKYIGEGPGKTAGRLHEWVTIRYSACLEEVLMAVKSLDSWNRRDEFAKDFSTLRPGQRICSWCASPFHKVRAKGLCQHCYGITRKEYKLKKQIKQLEGKSLSVPHSMTYDYKLLEEMATLAKEEGQTFRPRKDALTGLSIENLMVYISEQLVRRSLYSNYASIFCSLFSPSQRNALIHLLSQLVRERFRRDRRSMAAERLTSRGIYVIPPPPGDHSPADSRRA